MIQSPITLNANLPNQASFAVNPKFDLLTANLKNENFENARHTLNMLEAAEKEFGGQEPPQLNHKQKVELKQLEREEFKKLMSEGSNRPMNEIQDEAEKNAVGRYNLKHPDNKLERNKRQAYKPMIDGGYLESESKGRKGQKKEQGWSCTLL